MDKLVIASRNKHKITEIKSTLVDVPIQLVSALDFPYLKEVEEDKLTLQGNAIKKAEYVFRETGVAALSDDTGLEVDALDGRPGVFSARYSGEGATYQSNAEKLLAELEGVQAKDRKAQFRTVLALVTAKGIKTFEGVSRGEILTKQRGNKGFGYDPVFQPEGYNQSFAELDEEEKNKISHRGKAIQKFYKWLKSNH